TTGRAYLHSVDAGKEVAWFVETTGLRARTLGAWSATRTLELRGDMPGNHMRSRPTTPLLRNPADVRHCSQHAGANVDFGERGCGGLDISRR
ncbi:MAG TPA: hypothetical protein VJ723_07190, partial [Candidatus Angelobacter sp.]|nr:hypothetical protein [Candidatus Angelobacter sp.]